MLSRVEETRRHADALRSALLSPTPEPIEQVLPDLETAAAGLADLRAELEAAPPAPLLRGPLLRELQALRLQLYAIARLAAEGERFQGDWARMLGASVSGYTSNGEAATLTPAKKLQVKA